ncbi:hypothetical protein [Priestia aryabhattai]|uniref:hypothetical protein n=1 Tax=Priestia aryabhattai TaxID=412384 RepID=UPI0030EFA3BE
MAGIGDNYTFKEMEQMLKELNEMKSFFEAQKLLGIKDNDLEKRIKDLDALAEQFEDLKLPDKFNQFFSERGWIAYESLNLEVMKKCVSLAEQGEVDEAEDALLAYFNDKDEISTLVRSLTKISEFSPRRTLIMNALEDHFNGRYYASVPIMLMMIDGFVNDIEPKGFFAEGIDLTVWDTIAAHKTGLQTLSAIFGKGRNKTTDEEITLPYRNGILHGRDLGYANVKVSAKTLATLLALGDWASAIKKGNKGIEKEYVPPTKAEARQQTATAMEQLKENAKENAHMDKWKPREIEVGSDIPEKGEASDYEEDTPERTVISFLNYLLKKNYGNMAMLLSKHWNKGKTIGVLAGEVREIFERKTLIDYKLVSVKDTGCAITEVELWTKFKRDDDTVFEHENKLRLSYEDKDGKTVARGYKKADWRIMMLELRQMEVIDFIRN